MCLFTVHFAGCCFYLMAANYPDPKRTWLALSIEDFHNASLRVRYVTSIYWSIVTITTTGYGDLHPVNDQEMTFGICYLFFILGLQAYLIGNMTNLVVHGTGRTRKFVSLTCSQSKHNSIVTDIYYECMVDRHPLVLEAHRLRRCLLS